MGSAGFASAIIKPTALALNVLVPAIGCVRFYRSGLLTWRSAIPSPFLVYRSHAGRRFIFRHLLTNPWPASWCSSGAQMVSSAPATKPLDRPRLSTLPRLAAHRRPDWAGFWRDRRRVASSSRRSSCRSAGRRCGRRRPSWSCST